jgi:hypothetical protein
MQLALHEIKSRVAAIVPGGIALSTPWRHKDVIKISLVQKISLFLPAMEYEFRDWPGSARLSW